MEAADAIVGRRTRQFRTTEEKLLIVEETRRAGVSVATVARAHGVNANQVFYWRKLYAAGQLESTAVLAPRDMELPRARLLPVVVDEGADRQAVVAAVTGSTLDRTADSFSSPGMIELTLPRGQVRIAGQVDMFATIAPLVLSTLPPSGSPTRRTARGNIRSGTSHISAAPFRPMPTPGSISSMKTDRFRKRPAWRISGASSMT